MSKNNFQKLVSSIGSAMSKFFAFLKFEKIIDEADPNATVKRVNNMKRVALMIGLLLIVLIVSTLLLHVCQDGEPPHGSVDIPGNVIDPQPPEITPKADLRFNKDNAEENLSFNVEGMNGGDSKSALYRVIATYNSDFVLKYDMTIRDDEEFQKLAEIMKIKAELVGTDGDSILYDGLLSDMSAIEIKLNANTDTTTEYLFRITMYLDAPLGDQYYEQKLIADMSWWIEEQDNISIANNEFTTVSKATPPDPPTITPNLKFITVNEGDNTAFYMKSIKNGDSQTKYFAFEVSHGEDTKMNINKVIVTDSKLNEVLKVKVELVGENGNTILYDGLLKDLTSEHTLLKNDSNKTTVYYKVTVTADGLTEDYCENELVCDLSWSLVGTTEQLKVSNNTFVGYDKPITPPDPPAITPDLNFITKNEGDNVAFDMKNIKNGDSKTKYFAFEVTHGKDIKVVIRNDVVLNSKLNRVLKVKVELVATNGNVTLYEGLLKDLYAEHTLSENDSNKSTVYYKITVTADGLTENYCETKLVCDLSWSLDGTSEQLKVPSNSFVAYNKPITPPPQPPETATSIELTAKNGYDNVPFDVENMLPGDSVAQYYCVSVTHDSMETVRFYINADTSQKLSNVLKVKVEQLIPDAEDKVLYDGLMKNCSAVDVSVTATTKTVTPIYYRITVYTNGAEVGNEYVGESLTADFSWQLQ